MIYIDKEAIEPSMVVLVFTLMSLWYLSIGEVYNKCIISDSIAMCAFLLLKCPLLDRFVCLLRKVIIPSPLISSMLICIFLFLSIIVFFSHFVQKNKTYQWKGLPFGLATGRIFSSLTKLILFLYWCKSFCIIIYLDGILLLIQSNHVGKRACSFLSSLWVWLGLCINYQSLDFAYSMIVPSRNFGDMVDMSVSLSTNKHLEIQELSLLLLRHNLLQSIRSCLF